MKNVGFDRITFFAKYVKLIILALAAILCIVCVIFAISSNNKEVDPKNDESVSVGANENDKYNILIMGIDDAAELADVMMLVSFDTNNSTLTIAQLPRDTYAEYTANAYRKLNGALSSLGGGRQVAEFLESAWGIEIHHYITVKLEAVSKTVDLLGGVEINVPEDMSYKDPYQDLEIKISAGRQTLNGETAVQFIRYRAGYLRGDVARLDAQKLFLAALGEKIIQSGIVKLSVPVMTLISNSESDMSYSDCMHLVSMAMSLDSSRISFLTLPGGDVQTASGTWYYILNRRQTAEIMRRYFVENDRVSDYGYDIFDKNRVFTGEYSRQFNEIYYAHIGYDAEISTAEKLNRDGITIE